MMEHTKMMNQILMASIFEVFERMFYVFLEPVDSNNHHYDWRSSITFSGPVCGEVQAFFSQGFADGMVQNMLSITSSEITEQLRTDCLKESVNMVCGNFLRNYDATKVFDLSLPVCSENKSPVAASSLILTNRVKMDFMANEGRFGIILAMPDYK